VKSPRSHALVVGCVVALPIAAAVLACTAGDELAYSSAPSTVGGTDAAADTGRVVGDSMVEVPARVADGATLPGIAPLACAGLTGACDPTAGMGCCLRNVPGNVGADNACFEQVQHFSSSSCGAKGDVFLACLTSDADNTCCWQSETSGAMNTRYRASCKDGVEACDPGAAGGGVCASGGACTAVTCKGVIVGYCGGGAPPCQP
jgi:hypothetical protein